MFEILTDIKCWSGPVDTMIVIGALVPIAIGGYFLWAWLEKEEPFDK